MRKYFIHPVLLSILPAFSVYVHNVNQLAFSSVIWILSGIIILVSISWYVVFKLIKNNTKSAMVTSVFWVLFFSYRHILWVVYKIFYEFGIIKTGFFWAFQTSTRYALLGVSIVFFALFKKHTCGWLHMLSLKTRQKGCKESSLASSIPVSTKML